MPRSLQLLQRSSCPLSTALDLLGDRWSLLLIRDLLRGKQRYEEFLASEEGIATNILASRLKHLVERGFAIRSPDPADGRRILYRLTALGESTRRFLVPMTEWSSEKLRPRYQARPGT